MRQVFRRVVSEQVGEGVFYSGDIEPLVSNLGGPSTKVRKALKDHRIDPTSLGINPKMYGCQQTYWYRKSDVWDYLKALEAAGRIRLSAIGIESFDDIFRLGYDKRPAISIASYGGRRIRPKPSPLGIDDTDPSWDDTIRQHE